MITVWLLFSACAADGGSGKDDTDDKEASATDADSDSDSDSDMDSDSDGDADTDGDGDGDGDGDTDADADTDADTDGDSDTDSDADTDTDTDADTDTAADTGEDVDDTTDSDSQTEPVSPACEFECQAHCYSLGGTVMDGSCATEGYKCCDMSTATDADDSEAAEDSALDSGADSSLDTETGMLPDSETDAGDDCIAEGSVTYTITNVMAPAGEQAQITAKLTEVMDLAMHYYNCYTDLYRAVTVEYNPDVATADGSINGNIRFGSEGIIKIRVALHEMGHTMGVGTTTNWTTVIDGNGQYIGETALALLRELDDDPGATLSADGHCFWPYGLSMDHDYNSEMDLINHAKMIKAITIDMGIDWTQD